MVDVGAKATTARVAHAQSLVRLSPDAARGLREATLPKGDAFATAQIAGILAAKQTGALIPLAHPLPLDAVEVRFTWADDVTLAIDTTARTTAKTGVEMEALVAASIAALTIYDMCKAMDKSIEILRTRLIAKSGGKSGDYRAGA